MVRQIRVTGKELIKILQRYGFAVIRTKGSHHFLQHFDGRTTTVPVHRGEIIGAGLLRTILRNTELSNDDLLI